MKQAWMMSHEDRKARILRELRLGRDINHQEFWLDLLELEKAGLVSIERTHLAGMNHSRAIVRSRGHITVDDVISALNEIRGLGKSSDDAFEAAALHNAVVCAILRRVDEEKKITEETQHMINLVGGKVGDEENHP